MKRYSKTLNLLLSSIISVNSIQIIYYESLIYTVLNGHYLKFDIFYLTILKKYILKKRILFEVYILRDSECRNEYCGKINLDHLFCFLQTATSSEKNATDNWKSKKETNTHRMVTITIKL